MTSKPFFHNTGLGIFVAQDLAGLDDSAEDGFQDMAQFNAAL
ncbi:MAG: hypothetical protein AAF514_06815 [Verrucomicrobiota bacterium]